MKSIENIDFLWVFSILLGTLFSSTSYRFLLVKVLCLTFPTPEFYWQKEWRFQVNHWNIYVGIILFLSFCLE